MCCAVKAMPGLGAVPSVGEPKLGDQFEVIERSLPRWSVLGSVLDRGQLLQPRQRSCGVGQDYLVINQRGQVAKCHMEIERTLGDVFSGDPLTLVRQDRTTALNLLVEEKDGCCDTPVPDWLSRFMHRASPPGVLAVPVPEPAGYAGFKIIVDDPALEPGLGFVSYATALAEMIQYSRAEFAVGIFGGWGSGKSTLMEAVRGLLASDERVVTVWFSAWRYEKDPNLIVPRRDDVRRDAGSGSATCAQSGGTARSYRRAERAGQQPARNPS
jgi:hypothetical protein